LHRPYILLHCIWAIAHVMHLPPAGEALVVPVMNIRPVKAKKGERAAEKMRLESDWKSCAPFKLVSAACNEHGHSVWHALSSAACAVAQQLQVNSNSYWQLCKE
jgi:hypothetical protein